MSTGGALESVEDDLSLLDNEDIESVEDIESILGPEETSNQLMPDVGASNLDEVLEKRRAWKDYRRSPNENRTETWRNLTGLSGVLVGLDVLGVWGTAGYGVGLGSVSAIFYAVEKRSNQRHSVAKEHLDEIDDKLEDCYVLPADYDLTELRDTGVESIMPYENVLRHFEGVSEAEDMAESELKGNYPEEDWEDEWSDFTDSEQYSEGMQVVWLDEQDNVHGEKDVVKWKIECYKENGEEYEVVHESYGSTTDIEEVEEIKGDGENSLEMARQLKEMFNTPDPQYRVRKPA